jgi:hypothetical protein
MVTNIRPACHRPRYGAHPFRWPRPAEHVLHWHPSQTCRPDANVALERRTQAALYERRAAPQPDEDPDEDRISWLRDRVGRPLDRHATRSVVAFTRITAASFGPLPRRFLRKRSATRTQSVSPWREVGRSPRLVRRARLRPDLAPCQHGQARSVTAPDLAWPASKAGRAN